MVNQVASMDIDKAPHTPGAAWIVAATGGLVAPPCSRSPGVLGALQFARTKPLHVVLAT